MTIRQFWTQSHSIKGFLLLFILIVNFIIVLPVWASFPDNYVDGFDYPVGKPDATGYYNAQGIAIWNSKFNGYHLGEDWNKKCGGDCDLNDPIYAIANGRVVFKNYESVWGNVVIIRHTFFDGRQIDSQYAHLKEVYVSNGDVIVRGQKIGSMGKGDRNAFPAHLHFEIRENLNIGVGTGYGLESHRGYLNPSEFINSHRPVKGQTLSVTKSGPNSATLSWDKNENPGFDRYEIYRSEIPGGTENPDKRILHYQSSQREITNCEDKNLEAGKTYYYRIFTYYKNGLIGKSEETGYEQKREITKITDNVFAQTYPVINGDYVIWEDARTVDGKNPKKIYYYNLKNGTEGEIDIQSFNPKIPMRPDSSGDWIVFSTNDNSNNYNLYCYDLTTKSLYPITQAPKDQFNAVVSKEGIVVWTDLRNGNADLYYLNLMNAEGEREFVKEPGQQINPRIWGNKVAWKDQRTPGRYDLYIKEIDGEEEVLATDVGSNSLDIWEDYVVWTHEGKLNLIDLKTKQKKVIVEAGADSARIRDGKIVFTKLEGTNNFIHVYDIAAAKTVKIDFALPYASHPFISGNVVVFDHSEKQAVPDMDIYLVYI